MEKIIKHPILGSVKIRKSPRAKRYILRVVNGEVIGTIPQGGGEAVLMRLIDGHVEKLLDQVTKCPKELLDERTVLNTFTFSVHIFRSDRMQFYVSLKDGVLYIACPKETNFELESVQKKLETCIIEMMRFEAIRILPHRLMELAKTHQFTVAGIKIQNSKHRWGSCSSDKKINLSLHLMLLPLHLIDYVLLHELCHTREMNHSDRFWSLLDEVTNGQALALREELKNYHTRK